MNRRHLLRVAAAAAVPTLAWQPADAQGSGRPLRLFVGSTPGSTPDVLNRHLGDRLAVHLNRPVVIENKPSAGGVLALQEVRRAAPDGNTVAAVFWAQLSVTPSLMPHLPYRPLEDFEMLGTWVHGAQVLVSAPGSSLTSLEDVVARARREPGSLQFGTPGNVTPGHLLMELWKADHGIDIQHIPYRGPTGVQALLRGDVPLLADGVSQVLPHVQAGKMRPLAVFASLRSPALPEARTFGEAGYRGLDHRIWHGFVAPRGTPPAFVDAFGAALRASVAEPELKRWHEGEGRTLAVTTPAQMRAAVTAEIPLWADLVRRAGISLQ